MTMPAGTAAPDDSPVLHAAIGLFDRIDAASAAIERERHLPREIAAALKDAGVFGMGMPSDWGGPELDPLSQYRVIEAIAMANGSAGWCTMINCDGGYAVGFLEESTARAMYSDIWVATGASVSPTGTAVRENDGYRVSGRFPFVSGAHHCEWVFVGCHVTENGVQAVNPQGVPETRQCFLRRTEFEILDTWDSLGLRGTGSNHLAAESVFVEAERTFSFQDPALAKRPGPMYAFPQLYMAKGSAPALGIARRAIDFLAAEAGAKSARRYRVGDQPEAPKRLSESSSVQTALARADVMVAAARNHAVQVIGELWQTLLDGRAPQPLLIARFRTLYPHVVSACAEAVQLICKAAGGAAVYEGVLARCLRDILAMNQHVLGSARQYETAGRLLLGLEPFIPLL